MRVVVSGTHASGKSTLIGDFVSAHPGWSMLPDPFEYIDSAEAEPGAGVFFQQLRLSAERLLEPVPRPTIAERGPLDFLAYLDALDTLGRPTRTPELFARGASIAARAMAGVDLLVLLPLTLRDPIAIGGDEDPALRDAMDAALLELADDPDLTGGATVIELVGDPAERIRQLDAAVARFSVA